MDTIAASGELLSDKEQVFCQQYIIDWNGARAAREAGYSERSARELANTMLRKDHIKAHIDYLKGRIEELAELSKLGNVMKLKEIAYDDEAKPFERIKAL